MDSMRREENPLLDNAGIYKQQLEARIRQERKSRFTFVFGLLTVIFSLIGFLGCILFGINFFREKTLEKKTQDFEIYNELLVAVAAVDPAPFDDITGADMEELIEIAVWSIIGADLEPDRYDYSSGELAIPVAEVEAAYTKYFGTDKPISHTSVTGYGYEFSYNAELGCYYIPLTTIEPFYTPDVTEAQKKGDTVTLTVGLINANAWMQDSKTGAVSKPAPDKFIKVTLRGSGASSYIGSIRTSSLPETALVEVFTTSAPEATTAAQEEATSAAVQ